MHRPWFFTSQSHQPASTPVASPLVPGPAGSSAANLRASLKGGHVVLKNLELDLSSLLQGLPLQPTRAFAGQLKLDVPWTALSSQPTRVQLDNVEIALDMGACSPHGAAGGDADPGIFADAPPEPPAKRKADWFGLQETMKGIASRMEVAISNLILRVSSCGVTAVAVVPSVLVSNVDDPASAVAKALRIAQASLR